MTLPEQISLTRFLQNKGKKAVQTKEEARKLVDSIKHSILLLSALEIDAKEIELALDEAERAYSNGFYNYSLTRAKEAKNALDLETHRILEKRYLHLRHAIELGFTYPSEDILELISEGELTIPLDAIKSAEIAEQAEDMARDFLADSRETLISILQSYIEEDYSAELQRALDALMNEEGDLGGFLEAYRHVFVEIDEVYARIRKRAAEKEEMMGRVLQDVEIIKGMWDQADSSQRRHDFRQSFDTLYRIDRELEIILRHNIGEALEFIEYRYEALSRYGIRDSAVLQKIDEMRYSIDNDPHRALGIFLELDDKLTAMEMEIVSKRIKAMEEMIQIAKRVGHDINEIILDLDEVRRIFQTGDLDGAIEKARDVEESLSKLMPGFKDMQASFRELTTLLKEAEEYELDESELNKRSEKARDLALKGDFQEAHELIQSAVYIIHRMVRSELADIIIECQIRFVSAFRLEMMLDDEIHHLWTLLDDIKEGKYKGKKGELKELLERIERSIRKRAIDAVNSLESTIESHKGVVNLKPVSEMLLLAKEQLESDDYEECVKTVWLADKKLSNLKADLFEREMNTVRELVATGEYAGYDTTSFRREMYGLTYVGRAIELKDVTYVKELRHRLELFLNYNMKRWLDTLHKEMGRQALTGIRLDKQLEKIKNAHRFLAKGDIRQAIDLAREAKIEFEMAGILHREVYSNMLQLSHFIENGTEKQALEDILITFHEGNYRDADIASKRMLRSMMEHGKRTIAEEFLEIGERVQEAGEELGANVTSLRESVPQAIFFINNGDLRLASSLMEKAIRAGRAELISLLREALSKINEDAQNVIFRKNERSAITEMLSSAQRIVSGPEPERALVIISTLGREIEKRKELCSRVKDEIRHHSLLVSDAARIGVGTKEEDIIHKAYDMMECGELWLSKGLSELAVEQIGEIIRFNAQMLIDETLKEEELRGQDLEKDVKMVSCLLSLLEEREFHVAADLPRLLSMLRDRTVSKRDMVHKAIESLQQLREEMISEGMVEDKVVKAVEQVKEWAAKGSFISAYVLAQSHHINLSSSLDSFRRVKPRLLRTKQLLEESPERWGARSLLNDFERALTYISKGDSENGMHMLLTIEDSALRMIQRERHREMALLENMYRFLDEDMPEVENDHLLTTLVDNARNRCRALLKKMEPHTTSGYATDLMERYRLLVEEDDYEEAKWILHLVHCTEGLDKEEGERLVEDMKECRRRLDQAESEGIDLLHLRSILWMKMEPKRMIAECRRAIRELENIELSLVPYLDTELKDGFLYIRNKKAAIAVDVHINGTPLAAKLGMGEEVSHPVEEGRGLMFISYRPLLNGTIRTKRVLV